MEASLVHHPDIQKEVDDILAKNVTEPCTSGAGSCSNVFVVFK